MSDAPTPLDLDAIETAIAACRTYNFGMYQADRLAHEHAPALVEDVKRLRAEVAMTARPAVCGRPNGYPARECTREYGHEGDHWHSEMHLAAPSATREDPLREALGAYRAEVDRAKGSSMSHAILMLAGAALANAVEAAITPKEDQ